VVATSSDVGSEVGDLLLAVRDAVNGHVRRRVERYVDEYLASTEAPAWRDEARQQAHFRARVVSEIGGFTAAEVAARNQSEARNRSRLVGGWRDAGRIFSVPFNKRNLYLSFQFDDATQPRPVIEQVIQSLDARKGWDLAGWFLHPNGHLAMARPIDLLLDQPDAVAAAAGADGRRAAARERRLDRSRARAGNRGVPPSRARPALEDGQDDGGAGLSKRKPMPGSVMK
jgi:hypothetical protein